MGPLTYVAGPYSGKKKCQKDERFRLLTIAACMLVDCKKWNAFSPITHSHPMHDFGGLEGDWEFWKTIDRQYLEVSERFVIVTLAGWRESVGVTAEMKIAKELNLPFFQMERPYYENGVWRANLFSCNKQHNEILIYEPAT